MAYPHSVLIESLVRNRALEFRTSAETPLFWYAANEPGPFYVNAHRLCGGIDADQVLESLGEISHSAQSIESKAWGIYEILNSLYDSSTDYQACIRLLVERVTAVVQAFGSQLISGGERKDWFFSTQVARTLRLPHVFLFKKAGDITYDPSSQSYPHTRGKKVLHVADMIHNATSYFDNWQPRLRAIGAHFDATVSVVARGTLGLQRLNDAGLTASACLTIDIDTIRYAFAHSLLGAFALNEITEYMSDKDQWLRAIFRDFRKEAFLYDGQPENELRRIRYFVDSHASHLRDAFPEAFAILQQELAKVVS